MVIPIPTLALCVFAGVLHGAEWTVAGATHRWALQREQPLAVGSASQPVGRVLVWPQADDETTAQVIGSGGRMVPTRVQWAARGEPMEVWFDAIAAGDSPLVYVGAKLAPPAWEPPAGLVLEVRGRPNLPIDTAEQILALWDKAAPVQGRCWAPRIFQGANPFGLSTDFVIRFSGSFTVPTAGAWGFATISDDGSVLAIDGKQVVAWPGGHGPEGGLRGEYSASARLTPGRHRIDYMVVQGTGGFTAEVAWRPPGAKEWEPMPATAFAGVDGWNALRPETAQGPDQAAVRWTIAAHAAPSGDPADPYMVKMHIEAAGPSGIAQWRFDDGQRDDGRQVDHWFLAAGPHQVTLEVRPEKGVVAKRSVTALAHGAWLQPNPFPEDKPHFWRRELKVRTAPGMPATELVAAVRLALAADETGVLADAAEAVRPRTAELATAEASTALRFALALEGAELRRYADAAALLQAVSEQTKAPIEAARAKLHLGGMRLHIDGDAAAAQAVWSGVAANLLPDADRRLLAIYRADAVLLGGDAVAAQAAYRAAGTVVDPADRGYALRRRLRLELARDRLSQGAWSEAEAALKEIEWETPIERMGGETGLLLLRVWLARSEHALARTRARMLLAAGDGPRTAEILLLAAKVEVAAGDRNAAVALVTRLKTEHPFSEAAAAAQDLIPGGKP